MGMDEQKWIPTGGGNPSCQHFEIDPTTGKCAACGEQMIGVEVTAKTVLSAELNLHSRSDGFTVRVDHHIRADVPPEGFEPTLPGF